MGSAGVTLPQHENGKITFSCVRGGEKNVILVAQNYTK